MLISVTIPARQPEIKKQEVPAFEFTIKNQSQIKEGDTVVFSFWNKKDEFAACYGGIGKISEILSLNNRRFYVKVQDYRFFEHRVSVMLPNGKYVEQLGDPTAADIQFPGKGYQIRTISQESLDYIINTGGIQHLPQKPSTEDIEFFESELYQQAEAFKLAYERCMMCINQNGAIILPIPAMVNSAFSVELLLKAVIKEKTSECRSHKLSDLFNRLPIEIQQEIMNETNHSDFETQIERFSDAFVDFRYIYEDIFKTKDLNLKFWEDFSSAIYKIAPTHIARKGAPLYIDPSIK